MYALLRKATHGFNIHGGYRTLVQKLSEYFGLLGAKNSSKCIKIRPLVTTLTSGTKLGLMDCLWRKKLELMAYVL